MRLPLALLLLAACHAPAAGAPHELNDPFRAADLDVAHWVATFEGESREIAAQRDALVACLDLSPGLPVADIGAGTGLFLEPLAQAVGPTGRLFAVDISPGFVAHLEQRAAELSLGQVQVVLCDERDTGLQEASVQRAFVCDTYHHFEHPAATLASLHRALRRGGLLVVVEFERIPGTSRDWVLEHVRAGKAEFTAEIVAAGFRLLDEPHVPGLSENYVLRFVRD